MKKIHKHLLPLVFGLLLTDANAALDQPHDGSNAVGCLSCHQMTSTYPKLLPPLNHTPLPGDIDDTIANNSCWSCHNDITAPLVTTHSSMQTDNGYGDWTVECSVCHNQHIQEQNRYNSSTYGKYIRRSINLANIKGGDGNTLGKTGIKAVVFKGQTGANSFADDNTFLDGICEVCHTETTNPVSGAVRFQNTGNSDPTHYTAGNCMACHDHASGFAAACSSCHGFAPGALVFNPAATGSATAGAHTEHVSTQGYNCNVCHYQSFGKLPTHNNGDLHVTIGFAPFTGGILQGGNYDGQATVQYNTTTTNPLTTVGNSGSKTCSSLYCHGTYSGSGLSASPKWDDSVTGDCGTCHGASNTTPPASGSHAKHAGNDRINTGAGVWTNQMNIACTVCHEGIVGGTGPASYTIFDRTRHVNAAVDWGFDTADPRISGNESYSIAGGSQQPTDGNTAGGNRTFGTCSQIYCHSNVQPDGGVGPPTVYTTPASLKWGTSTNCFGCHAGETGTYSTRHSNIHTGGHDAHLTATTETDACKTCHNWFHPADFGGGCGSCHPVTTANLEASRHVNGSVDLLFRISKAGPNAVYNGTPQPGDGYATCSNVICHSDGTAIRTGDSSYANTTPEWGEAIDGCTTCHGNAVYPSPMDGMPDYANYRDGGPKENSHKEHMIDLNIPGNTIGCEHCHWNTTNNGTSIANRAYHGNVYYNIAGAIANRQFLGRDVRIRMYYDPSVMNPSIPTTLKYGGSCREISCHGSNYPVDQSYMVETINTYWGHYQQCDDCHMQKAVTSKGGVVGQGDIESYIVGDASHAMIDGDAWRYSGHGKTTGTYDVSGNAAANLTGAANCATPAEGGCDPCLYCHDENVAHDWENARINPFRLKDHGGPNGWNDVCLVCHGTGSTGYAPDDGGPMSTANRTTSTTIDKYHFGPKHGPGNDGGSLCWDCHDPHGDRVAGDGNIYMVHEKVTVDKLDAFGTPNPAATPTGVTVFTNNLTGSDYASVDPGPYTGICNACHATAGSGGPDHYSWQNGDGHNIGLKCTNCHMHSNTSIVDGAAFQP